MPGWRYPADSSGSYLRDVPSSKLSAVVAGNVRAERGRREWTQADLGKRLGWAPSIVGHLEQGRRDVTVDDLTDLCRAFGVPAASLLFGASPDDLKALGLN